MNTKKLYHIAFLAVASFIGTVNAAIIVSSSKIDEGDTPPTVSSTDLGQTSVDSYSATGSTSPGFGTTVYVAFEDEVTDLFNGGVGDAGTGLDDDLEPFATGIVPNNGNTFTVTFDLSVNTLGYDITQIYSVAGWNISGGSTGTSGRSNQGYQVDLEFADFSTATLIDGTWEQNNNAPDASDFWTTVSLTNNGGGVLTEGAVSATGVRSITFSNFDAANAGGFSVYREFDIIGTATIPEPSTFALLGLAGLAVFFLRRRRR